MILATICAMFLLDSLLPQRFERFPSSSIFLSMAYFLCLQKPRMRRPISCFPFEFAVLFLQFGVHLTDCGYSTCFFVSILQYDTLRSTCHIDEYMNSVNHPFWLMINTGPSILSTVIIHWILSFMIVITVDSMDGNIIIIIKLLIMAWQYIGD